jgi:hypothetical protein
MRIMAQTDGEGEREEDIVTLGRKTQPVLWECIRIWCGAVFYKGQRFLRKREIEPQVGRIDSVKMGVAIIL